MGAALPNVPAALSRARLLRPRSTADLIPRPRLIERLNRGLDLPLTVLITPAGFGKSTLLCEWLAQCPYPTAWLSLDAEGSGLADFVTHLIGALQPLPIS